MAVRKVIKRNTDYTLIESVDFDMIQHSGLEREYEQVEFRNCTFSNLNGIDFSDCLFTACNLSNASIAHAKLQEIQFVDCKLLGINFYEAKDFAFSVHFENSVLDYASFENTKLNRSVFKDCKLHGVNFTQADLSKTVMKNCDLSEAVFGQTNLSGVDFTTNFNFTIDPASNIVKKTKFLASNLAGLLAKFDLIIQH